METFGGIAVDVPASALSGFDAQLGAELRRWATAEPGRLPDGFTLAWLVTARARIVGRRRLWDPLLAVLAEIRRRHGGHLRDDEPFTAAYLDAVLAHRGKEPGDALDAESYLALPLLRLVAADPRSELDPARLGTLLLADLLRHEQFADAARTPEPAAAAERAARIAGCIAQLDPALGTAVPAPPGTAAGEWLTLSALPMTTAHDEYLVIRVLQAYEVLFGPMTALVAQAEATVRAGRPDLAAVLVRRAGHGFEKAIALAGLLAGARPDGLDGLGGVDLATPPGYRRFEHAVRDLANAAGTGLDGTGLDGTGLDGTGLDGTGLDGTGLDGTGTGTRPDVVGPDAGGPDAGGGALAAAMTGLVTSREVWHAEHRTTAERLCPTPPAVPPARKRPAPTPLVERVARPARARVGTPITLRAMTAASAAP